MGSEMRDGIRRREMESVEEMGSERRGEIR
jgi:hypothetical protein